MNALQAKIEKRIEQVLDLLTIAPKAMVETLGFNASNQRGMIRNVLANKNVIGIGIGEKISDEKPTGKLALIYYVEKKIPLSKLKADQAIPATMPESLSGEQAIPCDVIPIGKIIPEALPLVKRSPIQPGFSIGHVKTSAGTFGAVVEKSKKLFMLSNSHVFALSGLAKKGDSIVYPGTHDGGKMPADLVGKLTDFIKFKVTTDFVNTVDCAIVQPDPKRIEDMVAEIFQLGLPKGVTTPVRGMKVVKVGRTTGKTTGEIRDVHFRFTLNYDGVGEVGFIKQVLCTRYTAPGDSGSLVLEESTGKAVGLHFAGANGGSVFNPIEEVLAALKVSLVTKPLTPKKPTTKPKKVK